MLNNLQNLILRLKSKSISCFGRNKTNGERLADSSPSISDQKYGVPKDAQCSGTYEKKNQIFLHTYVSDDSKN